MFNENFYSNKCVVSFLFQYVYFSFISIATIGYGDFSPITTLSRTIVIIQSFFGMAIIAAFAGGAVYYLTYINSKFFVKTVTFMRRSDDSEKVSIRLSLEGAGLANIDKCTLSIFEKSGGLIERPLTSAVYSSFYRLIDVDLTFDEFVQLFDAFTEHNQPCIFSVKISVMTFTHGLNVKLELEQTRRMLQDIKDMRNEIEGQIGTRDCVFKFSRSETKEGAYYYLSKGDTA